MRVGFLQFDPIFGKVKENLAKVEAMIQPLRCDLLVLPELFNTGYTFTTKKELLALAEVVPGGKTFQFLQSIAREKKMAICGGFAERVKKRVYNSLLLVFANGTYSVYRKKHLYGSEKMLFNKAYESYQIVSLKNGVKVGLIICFDWIFPEAIRKLALLGAQIICHSANLVLPFCQDAMITRALENRVFVVTANRVGIEKRDRIVNRFTGLSQVISPEGRILTRAGETEEIVSVVVINPKAALQKNVNSLNNLFKDRRKDLY